MNPQAPPPTTPAAQCIHTSTENQPKNGHHPRRHKPHPLNSPVTYVIPGLDRPPQRWSHTQNVDGVPVVALTQKSPDLTGLLLEANRLVQSEDLAIFLVCGLIRLDRQLSSA
jgi:hypothetical protein